MHSSLWIDDDLVVVLVKQSGPSIEISLNSVSVLIDKHGVALSILDELVSFIVEAMDLSVLIFLNAVTLLIVSDDLITWQDGHFVALIVVIVKIPVSISYYSEAKFVEFLPFACFGVLPHHETVFWVVGLPLSIFVQTDILSFLILEQLLSVFSDYLPSVFLVSPQISIFVGNHNISILIDMFFVVSFSYYFEAILIISHLLAIFFSDLVSL